ncbi:hypothetical protein TYRP_022010 [Tyrophagus putrescentiae]|nr:hypothetical protein TYRP_022010 [Tyrophagus putrescentiae]
MSFLDLPDVALLNIFDTLPLKKLLNKQLVCRRWYELIPAGCLRRQSLVLLNDQRPKSSNNSSLSWFPTFPSGLKNFTNDDQIAAYLSNSSSSDANLNLLSLPSAPTKENLREMTNLFANLSSLSITINDSVADLDAAVFFLGSNYRLRDKLTHLTVKFALQAGTPFFSAPEPATADLLRVSFSWLFNAIDHLQCLQSLSLQLDVYPEVDNSLPLNYMPLNFLNRQLERLHFASTSSQLTHHLLNRLVKGGTLPRSISVATNSTLSSFLDYPQRVAPWFSKINLLVAEPIHDELFTFNQVHQIFRNLTTLSLGIVTICQLNDVALPRLATLRLLSTLTLHIIDNHQNIPEVSEPLPVLSTVRALRLTVCLPTHEYMSALHLPRVYPNLEVIAFDYFTHRCVICAPEGTRGSLKQIENCEQSARAYLQECPKLKTVL